MAEYTSNYNLYKPNRNDDIVVDDSLTENFETIDSEIKARQDDIKNNSDNIGSLQSNVSSHAQTIENLQTTLSNLSDNVSNMDQNLSDEIDSINSTLSDYADELNSMSDNVQNAVDAVNMMESTVDTLQRDVDDVLNRVPNVSRGRAEWSGNGVSMELSRDHGLGEIPSYVHAQAGSPDAAEAGIAYVEVDELTFTIHFENPLPQGDNNIIIYWKIEL